MRKAEEKKTIFDVQPQFWSYLIFLLFKFFLGFNIVAKPLIIQRFIIYFIFLICMFFIFFIIIYCKNIKDYRIPSYYYSVC